MEHGDPTRPAGHRLAPPPQTGRKRKFLSVWFRCCHVYGRMYFRHPNYAVVACEIALLPLVFGAWEIALVFSALNGALLAHRIRIENAALAKVAQ